MWLLKPKRIRAPTLEEPDIRWRGVTQREVNTTERSIPDAHRSAEQQHQRKEYVVKCPVCWRPGTFKLHREVVEKRMKIQIHVHHENEVCKIDLAEKEIVDERDDTLRITCTKCSRPGYIYVSSGRHKIYNKVYSYVHLGVSHKSNGKTKTCILMYLDLLETLPAPNPTPHKP